ncbi:hydroxymethylpyrimidine/phosphomethylpyrimidine kinase [Shimia thalassica]|uniref:bifunctional hydroxymethylpyrimidine kinase/phosphomethylpyrimidine kinase n=1 Tax=Shimia thalassica TaxID=1715693 RepID=UPI0026E198D9|nr:hydroxymethylpyrimidine/phosphomethylpyrimidine kinase [Shimia thalassica]MDO6478605.1 hydroxymethylpyrimidine/phosphomethylpyrimidine kinase [Shimia thalassica]MDP2493326.1 hydroxymethylpyrimidine/phosphomethylpyrimidine kinase [Shimia thalassica]
MTQIMIIGGTDSSGGAGLTRDTATAHALGVSVLPVVTAVTAQTDWAVVDMALMPPDLIEAQISAGFAGGGPSCVKIGMLGTSVIAQVVAEALADCRVPIVLDPVLASTSGKSLLAGGLPQALIERADLITPNLVEAARLTGKEDAGISDQARALLDRGAGAVLIKGGHGQGRDAVDHLFDQQGHYAFTAPRLAKGKRGTGCTLATAIACLLAQGKALDVACGEAKSFVHGWLSA